MLAIRDVQFCKLQYRACTHNSLDRSSMTEGAELKGVVRVFDLEAVVPGAVKP